MGAHGLLRRLPDEDAKSSKVKVGAAKIGAALEKEANAITADGAPTARGADSREYGPVRGRSYAQDDSVARLPGRRRGGALPFRSFILHCTLSQKYRKTHIFT